VQEAISNVLHTVCQRELSESSNCCRKGSPERLRHESMLCQERKLQFRKGCPESR
jgi:hypothetical protein